MELTFESTEPLLPPSTEILPEEDIFEFFWLLVAGNRTLALIRYYEREIEHLVPHGNTPSILDQVYCAAVNRTHQIEWLASEKCEWVLSPEVRADTIHRKIMLNRADYFAVFVNPTCPFCDIMAGLMRCPDCQSARVAARECVTLTRMWGMETLTAEDKDEIRQMTGDF
jgi:hypothetical protein